MADADVLKRRVDRLETALEQAEIDIADLRRALGEARREIDGLRLRLPPTQAIGKVHSPF